LTVVIAFADYILTKNCLRWLEYIHYFFLLWNDKIICIIINIVKIICHVHLNISLELYNIIQLVYTVSNLKKKPSHIIVMIYLLYYRNRINVHTYIMCIHLKQIVYHTVCIKKKYSNYLRFPRHQSHIISVLMT